MLRKQETSIMTLALLAALATASNSLNAILSVAPALALLGFATSAVGQDVVAQAKRSNVAAVATAIAPVPSAPNPVTPSAVVEALAVATSPVVATSPDDAAPNSSAPPDAAAQAEFPLWLVPLLAVLGGGVFWFLKGRRDDPAPGSTSTVIPTAVPPTEPVVPPVAVESPSSPAVGVEASSVVSASTSVNGTALAAATAAIAPRASMAVIEPGQGSKAASNPVAKSAASDVDGAIASSTLVSSASGLPKVTPQTVVASTELPQTSRPDEGKIPPIAAVFTGGAAMAAGAAVLGDRIEEEQSLVEATKFDVGQMDLSREVLADVDEGLAELPEGYGESRIVLMPRDPQWGYVYWDVPNEHREAVRQQGGRRLALRLYDVTALNISSQQPHSLQQYDCDELARDWYVPIPVSDREYLADIGYLTDAGEWLLLARSNPVRIPPVYPSDWFEDQFMTLDWNDDLRGRTFLTLLPPDQQESRDNSRYDEIFGMAQPTESLRRQDMLFGSMQQVPGLVFGSMQMASGSALESMLTGLTPPGFVPGAVSSYLSASGMGMSGIGMSGIGFGASMPPIRARKFWLVADAELIVYGATEPDATVTIAGRPVKLNPDGTFRFQMSFQDGLVDFPILAVAVDGVQTRSIHMKFNRNTPERHTNTKDEAIDESY